MPAVSFDYPRFRIRRDYSLVLPAVPDSQGLLASAAGHPWPAAASSSKSFPTISTAECRSQSLRIRNRSDFALSSAEAAFALCRERASLAENVGNIFSKCGSGGTGTYPAAVANDTMRMLPNNLRSIASASRSH
jgi:hypothetical protein